jgi:hypothetical protein
LFLIETIGGFRNIPNVVETKKGIKSRQIYQNPNPFFDAILPIFSDFPYQSAKFDGKRLHVLSLKSNLYTFFIRKKMRITNKNKFFARNGLFRIEGY